MSAASCTTMLCPLPADRWMTCEGDGRYAYCADCAGNLRRGLSEEDLGQVEGGPGDGAEAREAAIRALWEAATEHWYGDGSDEYEDLGEMLFDSSTALPGASLKGKDLYRIGRELGFIDGGENG